MARKKNSKRTAEQGQREIQFKEKHGEKFL